MHRLLIILTALTALLATGCSDSGQMVEAFKHNPTFMVMNIICSAVVLVIVVERFYFQMTRYRVNSKEFFAQIKKLVNAGTSIGQSSFVKHETIPSCNSLSPA